jgi:hypothetical protein
MRIPAMLRVPKNTREHPIIQLVFTRVAAIHVREREVKFLGQFKRDLFMRSSAIFLLVLFLAVNGCVISPRRTVNSGGSGGGSSNSEFSLTISPTSQAVTAGSQATYTVTVQAQNSFTGTVTFSASSGDGTIVASVAPTSISGGSGTASLTVLTSSSTPASNITITVNASDPSSSVASSTGVVLTVQSSTAAVAATAPKACLNARSGAAAQSASLHVPAGAHGFTATWDATPSLALDASIGFLAPDAGDHQIFSGLVQFSAAGEILARDGETFSASANVPYTAGETYHFRLVESLPAATYSLFVTPPGGTEVLLGTNLQVSANQRGAATVTGLGAVANGPDGAALEVCNITLQ